MISIWGLCDDLMNMTRLNLLHRKRRSIEQKFVDPQITFIWHPRKSLTTHKPRSFKLVFFWKVTTFCSHFKRLKQVKLISKKSWSILTWVGLLRKQTPMQLPKHSIYVVIEKKEAFHFQRAMMQEAKHEYGKVSRVTVSQSKKNFPANLWNTFGNFLTFVVFWLKQVHVCSSTVGQQRARV